MAEVTHVQITIDKIGVCNCVDALWSIEIASENFYFIVPSKIYSRDIEKYLYIYLCKSVVIKTERISHIFT